MTQPLLDVLEGGLLTTVQDAGRPAWVHLGVPVSGAADPWSLAVANLLVGNDPGAAALELTLTGPTLLVRAPVTIGLAGADLEARTRAGRRLVPGRSHRLAAGDVVEIPGGASAPAEGAGAGGARAGGARAYLAIPGGVDVPVVLGSRSTCLAGGFGGLDGRALRAGDEIAANGSGGRAAHAGAPVRGRAEPALVRPERVWPAPEPRVAPDVAGPAILRVIAGPAPGLDALIGATWRVGSAADRVGVRLDGDPVPPGLGGETTTHGVPWGSIQIPPDGRPIVLGVDHQTTGGYRVVGVVISADRPVLGQLRPGTAVRLEAVDREAALDALRDARDALAAGRTALGEAAGWSALIDAAGS